PGRPRRLPGGQGARGHDRRPRHRPGDGGLPGGLSGKSLLPQNSGRHRTFLTKGRVRWRPLFGSETAASAFLCATRVSCGWIRLDQGAYLKADPPAGDIRGRRLTAGSEQLTDVRPGEVDEFVALAREHRADGVEGEALGLLD